MATVGEQRVVLDNVRWSTYLSLLEDAGSRHGRMTYDQGVLELVSPSKSHEHIGRLIGPFDQMLSAIGQRCILGETELIRTFRAWIRMHVVES